MVTRSIGSAEERVELWIDRLTYGGDGIATWNGLKVFVRFAAPEERVRARIVQKKRDYAVAEIEEIIQPSPLRTEPRCQFYGLCGGCQLQHIDYTGQLVIKKLLVNDALQHIGKIFLPVSNIRNPGPAWHYRIKTQYPVRHNGQVKIGFFQKNTHHLLDIPICYLHPSSFNEIRRQVLDTIAAAREEPYDEIAHRGNIRHIVLRENYDHRILVVIVTRTKQLDERLISAIASLPTVLGVAQNINPDKTNRILGPETIKLSGTDHTFQIILNRKFRISSQSFFQVNPHQAQELCRKLIDLISPQGSETVLDLFCGVGMLSIVLAAMVKSVTAVEIEPAAVNDARFNAEINQAGNVTFINDDVNRIIANLGQADVVIIDPPRKGCNPETLKKVTALNPRILIYVSCNPATLARDLAVLEQLGYQCELVEPLDMFPQTTHVEIIAKLIRY